MADGNNGRRFLRLFDCRTDSLEISGLYCRGQRLAQEDRLHGGTRHRTDQSVAGSTRVADTPRRLEICRNAILNRDFNAFASIVELDSDMMHSVMMTSTPALHYWKPASLQVMESVRQWRGEGLPACYTVDAGANVHVLCLEEEAQTIDKRLREIEGVKDVLVARPGGAAKIVKGDSKFTRAERRECWLSSPERFLRRVYRNQANADEVHVYMKYALRLRLSLGQREIIPLK